MKVTTLPARFVFLKLGVTKFFVSLLKACKLFARYLKTDKVKRNKIRLFAFLGEQGF